MRQQTRVNNLVHGFQSTVSRNKIVFLNFWYCETQEGDSTVKDFQNRCIMTNCEEKSCIKGPYLPKIPISVMFWHFHFPFINFCQNLILILL